MGCYRKAVIGRAIKLNLLNALEIDANKEIAKIADRLRYLLVKHLHKRGFVVALSGGVDSSVSAALSVQAVGSQKVFGLLLPERESSSESLELAQKVVDQLGIKHEVFDITTVLDAIGCYSRRDEAIRNCFPEYGKDWKCKIAISGGEFLNYFKLVVQAPDGHIAKKRLELKEYLQIVAATNFKQRVRKTLEYYHADRLNYAVIGTPNRLEYDQGFFVKNGDGSADVKPIAHLYKTQVYALARYFGLPKEIIAAPPSTDTYSMIQSQDEFYFALPYDKMDLALWAHNHDISAEEIKDTLEVSTEQASFIYKDIERKRKTTAYLHWPALLVERVEGPHRKPEETYFDVQFDLA